LAAGVISTKGANATAFLFFGGRPLLLGGGEGRWPSQAARSDSVKTTSAFFSELEKRDIVAVTDWRTPTSAKASNKNLVPASC
jgi:hypothetical protein